MIRTLMVKKTMSDLSVSCQLYGQDTTPNQISVLSEGLNLKTSKIDILGSQYPDGVEQYFTLMKSISCQIALCLKQEIL